MSTVKVIHIYVPIIFRFLYEMGDWSVLYARVLYQQNEFVLT